MAAAARQVSLLTDFRRLAQVPVFGTCVLGFLLCDPTAIFDFPISLFFPIRRAPGFGVEPGTRL